ncbi:Plug domain-containing protein [Chamaesiphon sp. VAR_48_metabat_403]|uniref:Plug domain-containing protein n=1 Tax=Chamaesiphon sp. VAR_48_metabat_403 TaxID=2964700 RepID=UPI00286E4CFD|nr:Plug domain-containing protein [Chamaesiphon sp. VAR_48_metabat_403]
MEANKTFQTPSQIVPIEVIKDQSATRLEDAVQNVSGVAFSSSGGGRAAQFKIRGFDSFNNQFKNGLIDYHTIKIAASDPKSA